MQKLMRLESIRKPEAQRSVSLDRHRVNPSQTHLYDRQMYVHIFLCFHFKIHIASA